jgi:hypothetical protein
LIADHQANVDRIEQRLKEIEDKVRPDLVGVENDDFQTESARVEIVAKRAGKVISNEELQTYKGLSRQRDRLRRDKPAGMAQALCVKESGRSSPETHILVRGNPHVEGDVVEPGFLEVLGSPDATISKPPPGIESTGRRVALANWIANADNPLAARVMVNRIWQYHFGRGLVRSLVQRLWIPRNCADASRIAGLAGERFRARRMGAQTISSADHFVEYLSHVFASDAGGTGL